MFGLNILEIRIKPWAFMTVKAYEGYVCVCVGGGVIVIFFLTRGDSKNEDIYM